VQAFKLVTEAKHCIRQFVLQAGPNAILYGHVIIIIIIIIIIKEENNEWRIVKD